MQTWAQGRMEFLHTWWLWWPLSHLIWHLCLLCVLISQIVTVCESWAIHLSSISIMILASQKQKKWSKTIIMRPATACRQVRLHRIQKETAAGKQTWSELSTEYFFKKYIFSSTSMLLFAFPFYQFGNFSTSCRRKKKKNWGGKISSYCLNFRVSYLAVFKPKLKRAQKVNWNQAVVTVF